MSKKKRVDPIPEEFSDYEEAAKFWDTHDTTNYPDAFRTVEVTTTFRKRYYDIEIEEDVAKMLKVQAQKKGVTVSRLANELIIIVCPDVSRNWGTKVCLLLRVFQLY